MIKNSLFVLAIIFTSVFSISFLGNFNFARTYINLPLLISVFLIIQSRYTQGFVFAAGCGLLFDMFSSTTAGTYTIAMLAPLVIMFYSFRSLFARKSLYSIVLMMIVSTILYHVSVWGLTQIFFSFGWREYTSAINANFIRAIVIQLVVHVLLIIGLQFARHVIGKHVLYRFRLNSHA